MLQVRELRKSYSGTEVVRGVSFQVAAGECYGLLGPNGAGKTTTLRCCLGLTASDAGSIRLAALPLAHGADLARGLTLGLPIAHPFVDLGVLAAYSVGSVRLAINRIGRRLLS